MNLQELKTAAEAATPGPWEWPNVGSSDFVISGPDRLAIGHLDSPRTAKYVALANPATILKLIAVVEAAQEARRSFHATTAIVIALKELEEEE